MALAADSMDSIATAAGGGGLLGWGGGSGLMSSIFKWGSFFNPNKINHVVIVFIGYGHLTGFNQCNHNGKQKRTHPERQNKRQGVTGKHIIVLPPQSK